MAFVYFSSHTASTVRCPARRFFAAPPRKDFRGVAIINAFRSLCEQGLLCFLHSLVQARFDVQQEDFPRHSRKRSSGVGSEIKAFRSLREHGFCVFFLSHVQARFDEKTQKPFRLCRKGFVSSGREDSNFRPLAPHASTLANCATPRTLFKTGGKDRSFFSNYASIFFNPGAI